MSGLERGAILIIVIILVGWGRAMSTIAAREAKLRFGELLDTAQREPVTIEKHGRRVAVVLSAAEYDALVAMKRDRILAEIQVGLDQLDRGEGSAYDAAGLDALADRVKRAGAERAKPR
jgi:prevent-host-death family protein